MRGLSPRPPASFPLLVSAALVLAAEAATAAAGTVDRGSEASPGAEQAPAPAPTGREGTPPAAAVAAAAPGAFRCAGSRGLFLLSLACCRLKGLGVEVARTRDALGSRPPLTCATQLLGCNAAAAWMSVVDGYSFILPFLHASSSGFLFYFARS